MASAVVALFAEQRRLRQLFATSAEARLNLVFLIVAERRLMGPGDVGQLVALSAGARRVVGPELFQIEHEIAAARDRTANPDPWEDGCW